MLVFVFVALVHGITCVFVVVGDAGIVTVVIVSEPRLSKMPWLRLVCPDLFPVKMPLIVVAPKVGVLVVAIDCGRLRVTGPSAALAMT